jgi:hypothetical protein
MMVYPMKLFGVKTCSATVMYTRDDFIHDYSTGFIKWMSYLASYAMELKRGALAAMPCSSHNLSMGSPSCVNERDNCPTPYLVGHSTMVGVAIATMMEHSCQ